MREYENMGDRQTRQVCRLSSCVCSAGNRVGMRWDTFAVVDVRGMARREGMQSVIKV
jgi:hypothetical protein